LVSYDLIKPEKDYERLIDHLKTYPNWARPLKSVWVLVTDESAEQIENGINAHTDTNDKVLVVRTARAGEWRDGAWRNLSDEITEWLRQNL
jgi:hypothetical protein